ncbi:hypothetical protein GPL21_25010 [Bradyrhizobium pachyrhizi]|uniref:Uncharacterized protein n=1 Tax=Bradyrhizobium pachyrhizi TaxID=280333 RepID=A0A844T118_9BRAD|nr:hypothetical protein [Bradyrhizobium pachyrhizi]MVT68360.1 hypothetical protein [Bradyrhizobium pachyrhizi]
MSAIFFFVRPLAFLLIAIGLSLAVASDLRAQNFFSTQQGQNWISSRRTLQTSREKETKGRAALLRELETAARTHGDSLATNHCSTKTIDEWWTVVSQVNDLNRQSLEVHLAIAEANRKTAQSFRYDDYSHRLVSAVNDDLSYVNDYTRFVEQYIESQIAARLTIADAALRAGCIDLADAEYRKVVQNGRAKFSNRAMVGIQDVRDARARSTNRPTTR